MSKLLLRLLAGFFRPGIGDGQEDLQLDLGGPDDPPADDPPADDPPADDPPADDPAVLLASERTARASEKERADKFERELADLRANQPRPADPTVTDEDRRLADPNVTDLEKWQIRANRELRAGRMDSQAALAQAQDIADKTSFGQIAVTNAPLFKRYESRVEEEYQKLKAKGTPAPRAAILRFLIGNDAVEGKLTKKTAPAKKTDANQNLNRGRLPGARSDINGKNSLSDHEKRRARLENQQI